MQGTLSVVATPIGNLGDITLRAIETLKKADAIACEDTRVTAKLLQRYDVSKPLIIYSAQSARAGGARVLALLAEGKHVAGRYTANISRVRSNRLDQSAVKKNYPDIYQACLVPSESVRLTVTERGGGDDGNEAG